MSMGTIQIIASGASKVAQMLRNPEVGELATRAKSLLPGELPDIAEGVVDLSSYAGELTGLFSTTGILDALGSGNFTAEESGFLELAQSVIRSGGKLQPEHAERFFSLTQGLSVEHSLTAGAFSLGFGDSASPVGRTTDETLQVSSADSRTDIVAAQMAGGLEQDIQVRALGSNDATPSESVADEGEATLQFREFFEKVSAKTKETGDFGSALEQILKNENISVEVLQQIKNYLTSNRDNLIQSLDGISAKAEAAKVLEPKSEREIELETKNADLEKRLQALEAGESVELAKDPLGYLKQQVKSVIRREAINKSSFLGLIQEGASLASKAGVESELIDKVTDVDKLLDDSILNDTFMGALASSIKGEKVDAAKLFTSKGQRSAFKIADWAIWATNKLPEAVLKYVPLIPQIMKWGLPFIKFIPGGTALAAIYPIVDEIANFAGKFQQEAEGIRNASKLIRGESLESSEEPAGEVADPEGASTEQPKAKMSSGQIIDSLIATVDRKLEEEQAKASQVDVGSAVVEDVSSVSSSDSELIAGANAELSGGDTLADSTSDNTSVNASTNFRGEVQSTMVGGEVADQLFEGVNASFNDTNAPEIDLSANVIADSTEGISDLDDVTSMASLADDYTVTGAGGIDFVADDAGEIRVDDSVVGKLLETAEFA